MHNQRAFVALSMLILSQCLIATVGQAVMPDRGIFSDTTAAFVDPVVPKQGERVRIALRAPKGVFAKVTLRAWDGGERLIAMTPLKDAGNASLWQAEVLMWKDVPLWYRFILSNAKESVVYNGRGIVGEKQNDGDFVITPGFTTPDWVGDSVFYQIFPDRFFDGSPDNNVKEAEYSYIGQRVYTHTRWDELPTAQADFFGGDLHGINQKMSYLRDLGITGLYLNPVFTSPSNHKYDTQDYLEVDPHFGDVADLKALVSLAHKSPEKMRVILDGVFNHTGHRSRWFDKDHLYETQGAFESQDSPWFSFYVFQAWPDKYASWWGFPTLPKLNYDAPKLRDAIYGKGGSSVVGYWHEQAGIDGWRLDVPNELNAETAHAFAMDNHAIWREFRHSVKSRNKDAFITGEIWENAQSWLLGGEFDGVMNYFGFTTPVSKLLTGYDVQSDHGAGRYSVSDFNRELAIGRAMYPYPVVRSQLNSLSTHDIPRFLRRTSGLQKKHPKYNAPTVPEERLAVLYQAIFLQMTYVGAPMIYYGDEVGLSGGSDPDNRRTFPWNYADAAWRSDVRSFYKSMIALRKANAELRDGSFIPVLIDDANGLYGYVRSQNARGIGRNVLALLNFSEETRQVLLQQADLGVVSLGKLKELVAKGTQCALKDGAVNCSLEPRGMALYAIAPK